MTKDELLATIKEICPDAMLVKTDDSDDELCIATGLVEDREGAELVSINDYNPEPGDQKTSHYFAEDGTYGESARLSIIDTTDWNEEDWEEIDETPDWDRPRVAGIITNKYKKN